MGCMTWRGMCLNGAGIYLGPIRVLRKLTREDRPPELSELPEGVFGRALRSSAGSHIVVTAIQPAAPMPGGSAAPCRKANKCQRSQIYMGKIEGQRSASVSPAIGLQTHPARTTTVHKQKKVIMKTLYAPLVSILVLTGQNFHASAQLVTNLYSFGNRPDGGYPRAGLVQGNDGNFYGTTYSRGTSNLGTVFRISPGGSETNLRSEEHTFELQSPCNLVCRLLLEKK